LGGAKDLAEWLLGSVAWLYDRLHLLMENLLSSVLSREGHFRLESGYHTSVWLTLDALFTDQTGIAPLVGALAARLHPHGASAVCGPFVGGAFLAQLLAAALDVPFFYTQPAPVPQTTGLFRAEYYLTPELQRRIGGQRLAVVDEMISAGSSVRATIAAASEAGASVVVVGALVVLGDTALRHLAEINMPVEALEQRPFPMWTPDECPLCASGVSLETP
jgi:orotate phosphoribosyltransferase